MRKNEQQGLPVSKWEIAIGVFSFAYFTIRFLVGIIWDV